MAVAEIHRELIGLYALCLNKETVCLNLGESKQRYVVWQKMSIWHLNQGVDTQRVTPDGVCTHIWFRAWNDSLVIKSYHLTLLRETEIAIGILQCISTISTRSHTLNNKMPATVCTRNSQQGLCLESRIGKIIIKTNHYALNRLEIAGIENITGNLESIYLLASRETIGIVSHGIILVVIADSIAEIDGISGIGHQRILQFNNYLLSCSLDIRHLELWRRHNNLVGCIGKLDIFVEEYGYLLCCYIGCLICWGTAENLWWIIIVPSAIGLSHTGATGDSQGYAADIEEFLHTFNFNNCSICSRELLRRGTLC